MKTVAQYCGHTSINWLWSWHSWRRKSPGTGLLKVRSLLSCRRSSPISQRAGNSSNHSEWVGDNRVVWRKVRTQEPFQISGINLGFLSWEGTLFFYSEVVLIWGRLEWGSSSVGEGGSSYRLGGGGGELPYAPP